MGRFSSVQLATECQYHRYGKHSNRLSWASGPRLRPGRKHENIFTRHVDLQSPYLDCEVNIGGSVGAALGLHFLAGEKAVRIGSHAPVDADWGVRHLDVLLPLVAVQVNSALNRHI